jgi:hypothetical protein
LRQKHHHNFCRKLAKIEENCEQNISGHTGLCAPCKCLLSFRASQASPWGVTKIFKRGTFKKHMDYHYTYFDHHFYLNQKVFFLGCHCRIYSACLWEGMPSSDFPVCNNYPGATHTTFEFTSMYITSVVYSRLRRAFFQSIFFFFLNALGYTWRSKYLQCWRRIGSRLQILVRRCQDSGYVFGKNRTISCCYDLGLNKWSYIFIFLTIATTGWIGSFLTKYKIVLSCRNRTVVSTNQIYSNQTLGW